MGLFGGPSPCELDVEKATNEKIASEEWGSIMEVCDKAGKSTQESKDYLKAILKRMNNTDPHIQEKAVTLLDACVKNCGKTFHKEVASREFENEFCKLLKKLHITAALALKTALKRWAECEFKNDEQLNLIPSLYMKLKNRGYIPDEAPKTTKTTFSKDPNVVQSQEEEDQIAKAIELSLKETSGSPRNTATAASTSLYPSTNIAMAAAAAAPAKEPRKVRALYDFEAAEDNELTFSSGEIIFVTDDSDPNWWKGSNQRGEGLFPANFVTADLSMDPDQLLQEKKKKLVLLDESLDKQLEEIKEPENIEIDESKIDRLLHLLHEADPTNPETDTKEMLGLEREVNSMGGLIDKELERVDRKHAQLTQLSSDLVEALNLYHTLMREPQYTSLPVNKMPFGYQPPQPSHSMIFNGTLPHQPPQSMAPPMMGYGTMPHDRQFVPPQGPMPPNVYNTLPPNLPPPGHMPPVSGAHPPPMNMSPMNAPHGLPMHGPPPPHMGQEEPRFQGPYPPQGFPPGLIHQNGPANGSFTMPPPSNTHIM